MPPRDLCGSCPSAAPLC
ncbi:MAG: hypothetical protein ACJ72P_10440 [Nocardioides sp.]